MKALIYKFCLISAISALSISAFADDQNPPGNVTANAVKSIVGNYTCQRTDGSGNASTPTLSISSTGSTYTLEWDTNGSPILYGTGIIHPGAPNALSVVFMDAGKSADSFGDEIFQIKSDGTLSGNLISRTGTTLGTESCKKAAS